jgi:hypothetical protein
MSLVSNLVIHAFLKTVRNSRKRKMNDPSSIRIVDVHSQILRDEMTDDCHEVSQNLRSALVRILSSSVNIH